MAAQIGVARGRQTLPPGMPSARGMWGLGSTKESAAAQQPRTRWPVGCLVAALQNALCTRPLDDQAPGCIDIIFKYATKLHDEWLDKHE